MPVIKFIKENLFSDSILRGKEPEIIENPGDGFGVSKLPTADHLLQLLTAVGTGNYFLIFFGFCFASGETFREEDEHAFLQETGSWEDVQEDSKALCAKACFLNEFAGRGLFGSFTAIYAAGDQLPEILPSGVTVLLDEQDSPIGENGEDHDGTRMGNDFACRSNAARLDNLVAANPEDRASINYGAAENFCLLCARCT